MPKNKLISSLRKVPCKKVKEKGIGCSWCILGKFRNIYGNDKIDDWCPFVMKKLGIDPAANFGCVPTHNAIYDYVHSHSGRIVKI